MSCKCLHPIWAQSCSQRTSHSGLICTRPVPVTGEVGLCGAWRLLLAGKTPTSQRLRPGLGSLLRLRGISAPEQGTVHTALPQR